jgi:hypothetical protein
MTRVLVVLSREEWERAALLAAEQGIEVDELIRRITRRELARVSREGVSELDFGQDLAALVQPNDGAE